MSAVAKFLYTNDSQLADLAQLDGQIVFTLDTKQLYLDMKGLRIKYTDIQVLASESDRTSILAPVEGFYFVEETSVVWRYKGGWRQLTPSNLTPLFFGRTEKDFPPAGNPAILYISDDATYKWNDSTRQYICVSNKTEWKDI